MSLPLIGMPMTPALAAFDEAYGAVDGEHRQRSEILAEIAARQGETGQGQREWARLPA